MEKVILDYEDDFQVVLADDNRFYYQDEDGEFEVELIASLNYSTINDVLIDDAVLCDMFYNDCCGEYIDDDKICYLWFKQV